MGADLIVFIAKGPKKITKAAIKKAEKRAEEIIEFAGKILELIQKRDAEDGPSLTTEEEELLEGALKTDLLSGLEGQESFGSVDEAQDRLEKMAASTAKDEVMKFVYWWQDPDGRDTSFRQDPDDKRQQIVVCGDSTWDTGPNGGHGYDTMNEAYWYDIPQNLGVR